MIRSIFFNDKTTKTNLTLPELEQAKQTTGGLLWVSIDNETDIRLHDILHDLFHFHPLAIEDCQSRGFQTAKIDDYTDYLFIIAHALHAPQEGGEIATEELNIFLGENYLVTTHHSPRMNPIETIWQHLDIDDRLSSRGPDFLCHALLDVLVDEYMPVIDQMDDEIDQLEDKVLQKPDPATLERILNLKHATLTLRRLISPQREFMNILSRDEFKQIRSSNRMYFRDIYDHLVRVQDLSESVRDIVSGTLDIYLTATSNRLNEVMKALTIVSTIFLPLTFLAGVYGMNFVVFPEIHWRFGYAFVWVLFLVITIGMIVFFKKRKWI